ncbi:MAG: hypothetical protein IMZ53_09900 [Thermoplasmata archaeon]|nr:hypothetical protein [Thermoplasmata archaeon]
MRYRTTHAGNLYLKFASSHVDTLTASTPTTDETDSYTVYAGGGTSGKVTNVTVPAAAYNALTGMTVGDIFGIAVVRNAENATDTYADDLQIVGFLVEFTVANVSGGAISAATNAIVTLDEVKDFLGISLTEDEHDDFLQKWINYFSTQIEGNINNKVVSQLISSEITDGTDRYCLRTKYYPIVSVTLLQYLLDDVWTDLLADLTDFTTYRLNNPAVNESSTNDSFNIEMIDDYFPEGILNIKASYYAGYSTVPADLQLVCLEKVVEFFKNSNRHGGGSRFGQQSVAIAIGGGSQSTTYKDMTKRHNDLMLPFKRRYF